MRTQLRSVQFTESSIDEANRTAEFIISDETVDRYNTVFTTDGWELEEYRKNPVVLYGHDSWSGNPDKVIGTSEVFIEERKLVGRVKFEPAELNELAERVFRKLIHGTIRTASIRADVKDYRRGDVDKGEKKGTVYFTRQVLTEWSIVPLPGNNNAQLRSTELLDEIKNELLESEINQTPIIDPFTARSAFIKLKNRMHS